MSSARPAEPTATGAFFAYPADATGAVAGYWLAAGGTRFRMTGACKRALLATFEAVIERAVAIANFADTMSGVSDIAGANYATSTTPPFCAIDLGAWASASARARLGGKLGRGCPEEEWSRLVTLAWKLWAAQVITLSYNGKSFDLYPWQNELLSFETEGWIPDDDDHIMDITGAFDMWSMACDNAYRDFTSPVYAPWGSFPGGRGSASAVSTWLGNQLISIGRSPSHVYVIGSGQMYETMAGSLLSGTPHPLGLIADGKIGNWMGVANGAATQTTVRRSGAEWAVLQAMLANMQFTHLGFGYSATYRYVLTTRTWTRVFSLDPTTLDFVLVDDRNSPSDIDDYYDVQNQLYSGSTISNTSAQAGSLIVFGITKGSQEEQDLILPAPPVDYLLAIDGRDYVLYVNSYWPGAVSVSCSAYQTTSVVSVTSDAPVPYPAQVFESYVAERGGAMFVDQKESSYDDAVSHSVKIEADTSGQGLLGAAAAHANWLLGEVDPPRAFPDPDQIDALSVQRASDALWRSMKLIYPNAPNYPANDPNADRYFPIGITDQNGDAHYFTETSSAFETDGAVNVTFGSLELAFPDSPFGWDDAEWFQIMAGTSAMAGYRWRFKAMPAA